MKHILTLTAAAAAALVATTSHAAPANIVVVDTERVYRDCTACKAAVTQLQNQSNQAQARQQALSGPLRTEAQALQTAVNALGGKQPDAALKARIEAFQKKENDANQELGRLQQNLQSTQMNVRRQIDARLGPIFTQVMNAKGANVMLDTEATLARGAALDVTSDVLAALNQQLPSVSVTPMPQQQQPAQGGR